MKKLERTIEMIKAVGDMTRFRILKQLSNQNNNLCVSSLSRRLEIAQPTISQHLKILKNADIVTSKRCCNKIHYQININMLTKVVKQINELKDISETDCDCDD